MWISLYTHTHTHVFDQYWGQEYYIEGWGLLGCLRQAMTLPRAGRGFPALTTSQGSGWRVENGECASGLASHPLTICFLDHHFPSALVS